MAGDGVTSVGLQRARRMLRSLAKAPFIALVFEDEEVKLYTKGLDAAAMRKVEALVAELAKPDDDEAGA